MLKIIACISMLIDHIGYFLFPQVSVLRYIGRLAMPIFAFFIGEGCYLIGADMLGIYRKHTGRRQKEKA